MNQILLDVSDATTSDLIELLGFSLLAFIAFPFLVILFFKILDKIEKEKG